MAGRPLRSVFFCYAGDARYASYYSHSCTRSLLRWTPSAIGVFQQGGHWALICASPVSESEFTDKRHAHGLGLLLRRLERIRKFVGARHISLAGILPSYLARSYPEYSFNQPSSTPEVVHQAVDRLLRHELKRPELKVVLLGAAGLVGRRVHALLRQGNTPVVGLDLTAEFALDESPLDSSPVLLVDVSRFGALNSYIDRIPAGSVVLNEVFPEPGPWVLKELRKRGISLYHIAGVKARVIPSLPHGYRSAVPCCAICDPTEIEPVFKRLT